MPLLQEVLKDYDDIVLAYGESDEYSFVFRKGTTLYGMLCDITPNEVDIECQPVHAFV